MGRFEKTVTQYFAKCDWCDKEVDITNNNSEYPGFTRTSGFRELPVGWVTDFDTNDEPIYCCNVHMERARTVATLKALP